MTITIGGVPMTANPVTIVDCYIRFRLRCSCGHVIERKDRRRLHRAGDRHLRLHGLGTRD